jgi:hypothetical protein
MARQRSLTGNFSGVEGRFDVNLEVDNRAFISVCSAMSVYGNGFETVKVRRKPHAEFKQIQEK